MAIDLQQPLIKSPWHFIRKKGYGCNWTWETIQHYTFIQIEMEQQLVTRKNMDVNERDSSTLHLDRN
jgi:hypothetical protein